MWGNECVLLQSIYNLHKTFSRCVCHPNNDNNMDIAKFYKRITLSVDAYYLLFLLYILVYKSV